MQISEYVLFNGNIQGFWYFVRLRTREIQVFLRNPAKFPKKREIPQNPPEIFPNTCRQIYFILILAIRPVLFTPNIQNLSWNFVTATSKQRSKTNRRSWINVVKNWALATMWNALPLVHFSSELLLKEQIINPVKKTLNNAGHTDAKIESILAKQANNIPKLPRVFRSTLRKTGH